MTVSLVRHYIEGNPKEEPMFLLSLILSASGQDSSASGQDSSASGTVNPSFSGIVKPVKPLVMVILDTSGSMEWVPGSDDVYPDEAVMVTPADALEIGTWLSSTVSEAAADEVVSLLTWDGEGLPPALRLDLDGAEPGAAEDLAWTLGLSVYDEDSPDPTVIVVLEY